MTSQELWSTRTICCWDISVIWATERIFCSTSDVSPTFGSTDTFQDLLFGAQQVPVLSIQILRQLIASSMLISCPSRMVFYIVIELGVVLLLLLLLFQILPCCKAAGTKNLSQEPTASDGMRLKKILNFRDDFLPSGGIRGRFERLFSGQYFSLSSIVLPPVNWKGRSSCTGIKI